METFNFDRHRGNIIILGCSKEDILSVNYSLCHELGFCLLCSAS